MTQKQSVAPNPMPVDDSYWTALLAQEEDDSHEIDDAEEAGWTDADAFQRTPIKYGGLYYGDAQDWETAKHAYENDTTVLLEAVGFNKGGLLVDWASLRGFVPASQLVDTLNQHNPNATQFLAGYIGRLLHLRVIEIHPNYNRLILSERAAQVSPGTRLAVLHDLTPNMHVQGIVTNICDFGAFVDLGGVEGLIHISELSWGRVEHPAEILKRGQQITVFVMDITPEKGRIALSLKRLQPDPWLTVEERFTVGQVVQGVITSVVDFGAFACLEQGLEGLIHISELAEGHFMHPRNVVKEGETVRVRILNIDSRARRIGLSLRAMAAR